MDDKKRWWDFRASYAVGNVIDREQTADLDYSTTEHFEERDIGLAAIRTRRTLISINSQLSSINEQLRKAIIIIDIIMYCVVLCALKYIFL